MGDGRSPCPEGPQEYVATGWVLQNPNVSLAIIDASRPEQVKKNVKAAGVKLDARLMRRIDHGAGPVVERGPGKTKAFSPERQP